MTITLCNGKGGAGKTTLAVLLVLALRQHGQAVSLLDRDPQATATRWLATLDESTTATHPSPLTLIDTAPQLDSPQLAQSIRESNLVLLVSSSSPADLWSSQNTVETIRTHLRPDASARLIFNQVQPHTLLGRDLSDLSQRIGLPRLESHLRRRQVYQHAALLGWSALDKPARQEMLSLAREVSQLLAPNPAV